MKLTQSMFMGSALAIAALGSNGALAQEMPEIATKSGCTACHAVDKKVVGPAWAWVAHRYQDQDQAEAKKTLLAQMEKGGKGKWTEYTGGVPMPPYGPRTTAEQRDQLAEFILGLDPVKPPND
ncbi:hypothetical protein Tel_12755 [Candidatus Tenderia electrophaga]|uniref:Cytochrome c-551 n=1 Tax=Candidatus Tenderia electrophaga TaxID=1748243 RepID=A0A0S2TFL7_9GAMM|nr:hypothetical protein Tel_12755 [Candidatus Tenderia electrophaga]